MMPKSVKWNVVVAKVKYKSGTYRTQMYAPEGIKVGDIVTCLVLSGYETTCEVMGILKEGVKNTGNHGMINRYPSILDDDQKVDEDEEEEIMVNEIFNLVLVEGARGYRSLCKSSQTFDEEMHVVYEGTDSNMHVGTVKAVYPKGTQVCEKGLATGGFIVCKVDEGQVVEDHSNEILYVEVLTQLKQRKKAMEERAIWELLAEKDPEAKKLLNQLDELKK